MLKCHATDWPELERLAGCEYAGAGVVRRFGLCRAQTNRTWNGSISSDWFNATNWIPAGVPAPDDIVNFTNANGAITLTAPVTINGQFNWSGEP